MGLGGGCRFLYGQEGARAGVWIRRRHARERPVMIVPLAEIEEENRPVEWLAPTR